MRAPSRGSDPRTRRRWSRRSRARPRSGGSSGSSSPCSSACMWLRLPSLRQSRSWARPRLPERLPPPLSLSERFDVRHVVASVPGVEGHVLLQAHPAERGVMKRPGALLGAERAEEHHPPLVKRGKESERRLDGRVLAVLELRPGRLIVALDLRLVLGHRELEADVAVEVSVGKVVDDLPNGPSAWPVRCLELLPVEAGDGRSQMLGGIRDLLDEAGALASTHGFGESELADGVTKVHAVPHPTMRPPNPIKPHALTPRIRLAHNGTRSTRKSTTRRYFHVGLR